MSSPAEHNLCVKTCNRCGVEKPLHAFSLHSKGKFGRHPTCNACRNAEGRARYQDNREAILLRQRGRQRRYYKSHELKRKYGITKEEYERRLEAQGGVCAVCGRPPDGDALTVDHCHDTGQVRGLLCRRCNIALGMLGDDPALLRTAMVYLRMDSGGSAVGVASGPENQDAGNRAGVRLPYPPPTVLRAGLRNARASMRRWQSGNCVCL